MEPEHQTPNTKHQTPNTALVTQLKSRAAELGFALSGVAPATAADGFPRFAAWLDRGFAGEMGYLHKHRDQRAHPESILDGVRSVLMVGMEYGAGASPGARGKGQGAREDGSTLAPCPLPLAPGEASSPLPLAPARVASYAAGPDYHRYLWDRLNLLADWLRAAAPGSEAEAVADTAPLLERDFARRAGLGWVGKNTMLIHPQRGSFFFLGAVLTSLELPPDEPFTGSHCGTCTACLTACPTAAFPEPHVLDATKCISYLTIELRGPVPVELREPLGNWLYGCDVCQDVCPWNRKATGPAAFPHDPALARLDPIELLGLDETAFRERFKKTSLWRNRRPGLLRNAALVLGNTGDERALPALERAAATEADPIREAATWAIVRIRQRTSSVNSGLPASSAV